MSQPALALTDQTEQEMLRTDVVMVEPLRFFLSKLQHLAGALGKFIEFILGHNRLPLENKKLPG